MHDLVSVIIVTHNNWPDLELCIQSAIQQTYSSLELILIDNGSTDATQGNVESRFGHKLRYIRQENRGEAGGRNDGLRHSTGNYIQFIDGDDFIAPDKIEKQMVFFQQHPETDIVYGDVRQFQSSAGRADFTDWDLTDFPDMLAAQITSDGAGLATHSVLARKKVFDIVGSWDEQLPARCDQDVWIRAAWSGCRFAYTTGALAFYRRRPNQLTSDKSLYCRGREAIREKALNFVNQEPYRALLKKSLAELRFLHALSDPTLNGTAVRQKLALAHQTDSSAVPSTAYFLGWIASFVPGRRMVLKSRKLRPGFRMIAKQSGLRVDW